jgi:hypothetical protein
MFILTYGVKKKGAWTKPGISRLTAAEMRFIRSVEGNNKIERMRRKKITGNPQKNPPEGKSRNDNTFLK